MKEINENEKQFVKQVVEFIPNLAKVQQFLNDQYNVDSYFDEDNGQFVILQNSVNESLTLARAKEYAESKLNNGMCQVVFKN